MGIRHTHSQTDKPLSTSGVYVEIPVIMFTKQTMEEAFKSTIRLDRLPCCNRCVRAGRLATRGELAATLPDALLRSSVVTLVA